ncbi:hypothetical protein ACHHV8_25495 [Paenibacillus sp. TAB 01]|uniref:DUF7210 family protein n=1 Tax=Paenibacillus sp. TAB 01 TaxID=3368988 RepID=UPI0037510C81
MAKADETAPKANQGATQLPDAPPATQEEKIPAVFLTNCKHNRELYEAGQRVDLPEDVYAELLEAKAIRPIGE